MDNHVLACVCMTVLIVTGCFDRVFAVTGAERRDIVFVLVAIIVLQAFQIEPMREFNINLAVFAPVVLFAVLALGRRNRVARLFIKLSAAALVPLSAACIFMILEYTRTGYFYFKLDEETICCVQVLLTAAVLMIDNIAKRETAS